MEPVRECTGHSGLCLVPLPHMVVADGVTGYDILRAAIEWSKNLFDLQVERSWLIDVANRPAIDRTEGRFTRVSLKEKRALGILLEEAAFTWLQDATGEFKSPRQPEWAERVYDHLAFYVRCAFQQGWTT